MAGIKPFIHAQVDPLEDFLEEGCFILRAMVKSIKKGQGWSRVELVDDTGAVGIFHSENTQIETGNMYFFLVGDNRIHRYVNIEDVVTSKQDPFIDYLYAEQVICKDEEYLVVDFTHYKTKTNKMMAHIILSNSKKELTRVIAFPAIYTKALGKLRPGTIAEVTLGQLDDGTKIVKDIP